MSLWRELNAVPPLCFRSPLSVLFTFFQHGGRGGCWHRGRRVWKQCYVRMFADCNSFTVTHHVDLVFPCLFPATWLQLSVIQQCRLMWLVVVCVSYVSHYLCTHSFCWLCCSEVDGGCLVQEQFTQSAWKSSAGLLVRILHLAQGLSVVVSDSFVSLVCSRGSWTVP